MFEDRADVVADAPEGEGAELLAEVHAALTKFVVLPRSEAAVAVALWIAASHAQPAWEHATRLAIKSPLKRCGKSRLLDLVAALAYNVLVSVNISPAALVRSITNSDPPTLLVDEADTIFGTKRQADNNEDLRGLLNAGHERDRPYTRWDVAARRVEECPTFAMAAIAGIGNLPDTIEDRAVIVTMRRRAPHERVTPFRRRRDRPGLLDLRDRLHEWVRANMKALEGATPGMPVEDRAADTWEPLVAIADLAGGDWPELARLACKAMTTDAEADAEGSAGERLLADLYEVFGEADALYSKTILDRLHAIEEGPWADWYGRALTARDLAKLLRPYGVRSRKLREGGTTEPLQGYARRDLHEPWLRYVPTPAQPEHAAHEPEAAGQPCSVHVPDADSPSGTGLTCDVPDVPAVAQEAPKSGPPTWRCDGCGREVAAFNDMAGLPHPECGGRFRRADP